MNILNAKESHVEYISDSLAKHFSQANEFFKYPKYNDSFEVMHKHVMKRVQQGGEGFVYFVAEDESGNPLGFVNLLIEETNVGSVLTVIGDEKNVLKELLVKSIDYLKSMGVSNIQGEYFAYETDLKEVLMEMGIDEELVTFRFKI